MRNITNSFHIRLAALKQGKHRNKHRNSGAHNNTLLNGTSSTSERCARLIDKYFTKSNAILLLAIVAFFLIFLKTDQRMITDKTDFFSALWNAVQTRFRNNSTFILLSHCLCLNCFAAAMADYKKAGGKPATWRCGNALISMTVLTLVFWGVYLWKIFTASDPGTFASRSTGWLYWIQFAEGLVNLMVLAAAAAGIVTMHLLITNLGKKEPPAEVLLWILSGCCGSISLFLAFTKLAGADGKTWLLIAWTKGNENFSIVGYTITCLICYLGLGTFAIWYWANVISLKKLSKLLGKIIQPVFPGKDK